MDHVLSELSTKTRLSWVALHGMAHSFIELDKAVFHLVFEPPKSLQMVTAAMNLKVAPWKKSYDQPKQLIKKQRHYFANKGLSSQAMVFPLVMYGCESWTIKKAKRRRINAFELWYWRRLSRVPWTARRSNQSILKEISPGISFS